jgi:hypothetical protein
LKQKEQRKALLQLIMWPPVETVVGSVGLER